MYAVYYSWIFFKNQFLFKVIDDNFYVKEIFIKDLKTFKNIITYKIDNFILICFFIICFINRLLTVF